MKKTAQYDSLSAYNDNNYELAQQLATQNLQYNPQDEKELAVLADCYYIRQDFELADSLYQKIIALNPQNLAAQINHVDILIKQKNYTSAERLLDTLPTQSVTLRLRGQIKLEQQNYSQAQELFSQAVKADSANCWNWNLLSQAAQKNQHYQDALKAALHAVILSNGDNSQHINMAYSLYEIASETDVQKVLPILHKWQSLYPENGIVKNCYNAFFPSPNFKRADKDYVENIFDDFAASFEDILSDLNYVAPQLIASKILEEYNIKAQAVNQVLDLGCGTGLCGDSMHKLMPQSKFFGVDLSAQMLYVAKSKNIYSHLYQSDLLNFLQHRFAVYDIVTAADVLTYFGDLSLVFDYVYKVLKTDGIFAFSVSHNTLNQDAWYPHLSGRFLHQPEYVTTCLKNSGFSHINFTPCVLRKESDVDVAGFIFTAMVSAK